MSMNKSFISLLIFTATLFINLNANINIGVVTASNYVGDREVAWRIKIAGESLGWTVFLDEDEGRQVQNMDQLDWVICMLPNNEFLNPSCPNYLMVFHPFWYLNDERQLLPFYDKYTGYLLTINDRETIADSLKSRNKEFHFVSFYPSVYHVPYQEVELNNLVTMIPVWSNRLTDKKFRMVYNLLSRTGFTKFYGVHKNEDIITQGYMGTIPFDGVSVIDILQQHGIVLVLHSDIHNAESIPTSRIFEAAAASTVIISDQNPFVKKHFGDSVFYIDTSLSAKSIYNQIQAHMRTIYQNPQKALEMAKTAHQIFIENFEMSDQLLKLESLNREVIST